MEHALSVKYSELNIVKEILGGNLDAFDALVRANTDRVFRLALRMLGNREDAEDACQDVFLQVYKNLSKFRGDSSFATWVYSIAARTCLTKLRRSKSKYIDSIEDSLIELSDNSANPEESLYEMESARRVHKTLADLPCDDRLMIVFKYIDDLSHEEIAKVMGCSSLTSRVKLARAKQKFMKLFERTC